jgi:hypothetical protein
VTEKPLHVRVAEALGEPCSYSAAIGCWVYTRTRERDHAVLLGHTGCPVPRYDTDREVTGPLIEKYGIFLRQHYPTRIWFASPSNPKPGGADTEDGPTPLIAVCNLILALKAAGKLEVAA